MMTKSADLETVEKCAARAVDLIQQCIRTIRSIPEFSSPSKLENIQHVKLYHQLESQGLVNELEDVQELVHSTIPTSSWHACDKTTAANERSLVVHRILLPLIRSLFYCYEILDKEVQPPRASKRKPRPPRGMLSIQNYTDVAALLEFLVCTSILPNLQPHVLASVQDRARYALPKSLAGRIPYRSLMWATHTEQDSQSTKRVGELQQTAMALGRLVLLDRFRPMLLPRHLVDIYAAMFQSEELLSRIETSDTETSKEYRRFRQRIMSGSTALSDETPKFYVVDAYSHARACQALLFRGTKAPIWLRQRVSVLLTSLASQDLATIVQVFVKEGTSTNEQITGASMRLAVALTANPSSGNHQSSYLGQLCQQLFGFLDDPQNVAGVATVWAVIDQLSQNLLMGYLLPLLCKGLIPECHVQTPQEADTVESYSVHKTVRRIRTLLSDIPSSSNPWKLCWLFLCDMHTSIRCSGLILDDGFSMTLFGQLIRLASIQTVVQSNARKDALWCLDLLVGAFCKSDFHSEARDGKGAEGIDILVMALIYSVAPNRWDLGGYHYCIKPSTTEKQVFDSIHVTRSTQDIYNVAPRDMEQRSRVVVCNLIASLEKKNHDGESEPVENTGSLPSRLFTLLLLIYFSGTSTRKEDKRSESMLPTLFSRFNSIFTLATMALLPLLCEECSPLFLLQSDSTRNSGCEILGMIRLILDYASCTFGDSVLEGSSDIGETHAATKETTYSNLSDCDFMFREMLGRCNETPISQLNGGDENDFNPSSGNEILLSLSSIVLSMLIALLELGSSSRTKEEESLLSSMISSLQSLSTCTEIPSSQGADTEASQRIAGAELAEMASHAVALISSRSIPNYSMKSQASSQKPAYQKMDLEDTLKQAERDLQSEQAPFRARGVVTLRHIARGYIAERETANALTATQQSPLIQEIGGELVSAFDGNGLGNTVERLLRLSLMSLLDTESYVYLAGVQTIVALGDLCPGRIIPLLGRGVSTGVMTLTNLSCNEANNDYHLKQGQRVKLTEALLFSIRRRGSTVREYFPYLMDLMLFGHKQEEELTNSQEMKTSLDVQIQRETHKYFLRGNTGEDDSDDDQEARIEERQLRVDTGGPIFDNEEGDLVRAACITVVAELVSASHPICLAVYSPHLVKLATDALQLDASRPMRRSAALLCRELYDALLREHNNALENLETNERSSDSESLVIGMMLSGEKALFSVLSGYVEGSDTGASANGAKFRAFDPTTVCRCQEALDNRKLLENEGVFIAAELVLDALKNEENDPVAKILRSRLRSRGVSMDHSIAIDELRIDANSLKLV